MDASMKQSMIWRLLAMAGILIPTNLLFNPARAADSVHLSALYECQAWAEGRHMFYTDSLWRGGDCASTVDLGDSRVLWLFADSFIGIKPPNHRKPDEVTMIHNCLGVQSGYNPAEADFEVYWGGDNDAPGDYFPSTDSTCFWPCNGVRIGEFLIVFLMRICPSDSGLGFIHCGHAAYLLSNIERNPDEWLKSPLALPEGPRGLWLGAAALVQPPYIYLLNINFLDADDKAVYLARWHIDSLLSNQPEASGQLQIDGLTPGPTSGFEWWMGEDKGWSRNSEQILPEPVFTGGASEFSVIYDEKTDRYIAVQAVGFGAADIMVRSSPELTGPWTDLQLVYQPGEKTIEEVMIYAAKAHPELPGADLVITYNTNAPFRIIVSDTAIYYPTLIRCNRSSGTEGADHR